MLLKKLERELKGELGVIMETKKYKCLLCKKDAIKDKDLCEECNIKDQKLQGGKK